MPNSIDGPSLKVSAGTAASSLRAYRAPRELSKRLRSRDRMLHIERGEIAFTRQRCFQELVILPSRYFDRTEGLEMIRDELGVQKPEAAGLEPGNQMDERNLGGV